MGDGPCPNSDLLNQCDSVYINMNQNVGPRT